jgi:hypothetical protein
MRLVDRASLARALGAPLLALLAVACDGSPTEPRSDEPEIVFTNFLMTGAVGAMDSAAYWTLLPPGRAHRISLRATSGSPNDTLVLVVRDSSTNLVLAEVRSAGSQEDLHETQVQLAPLADPAFVWIVVRGAGPGHGSEFEFMIRSPDPDPEHTPSDLTLGDTVTGERYDGGGTESDTWAFAAIQGGEYIVELAFDDFVPGTTGTVVSVFFESDQMPGSPRSHTLGASDFEGNTWLFTAPTTGTHHFRLVATGDWSGSYRFVITPRVRAPEGVPAVIAVGDTIAEAIGSMGDIDEYTIALTAGSEIVFAVATDETWPMGLRMSLAAPVFGALFNESLSGPIPTLDLVGSAAYEVAVSGIWTVRVSAPWGTSRVDATGGYRFQIYEVDRAPESVPATITLGVAVSGESIDRRGDVDEFTIALDSGAYFTGTFVSETPPGGGAVAAELIGLGPNGEPTTLWSHVAAGAERDSTQSLVVQAPATGSYALRVTSPIAAPIPYSFLATVVDPSPESAPVVVPLGVWVDTEQLDFAGDVDRFLLDVVSQKHYAMELEGPVFTTGAVRMLSPLFGHFEVRTDSVGLGHVYPFASGTYELRILQDLASSARAGPYRFRIRVVDDAPETVDSMLTIGVPVTTEAIDDFGDTDIFVLTVSSADSLRITVTFAPAEPGAPTRVLGVYAFDPAANSETLFAYQEFAEGTRSVDWRPPRAGTFTYRFWVWSDRWIPPGRGAYTIAVTRLP